MKKTITFLGALFFLLCGWLPALQAQTTCYTVWQDDGGGTLSVYNSIVYGNTAGLAPGVTLSSVNAGAMAANLVDVNPVFKSRGDYNVLSTTSPACNVGDNSKIDLVTDIKGRWRKDTALVDIGAYELTWWKVTYAQPSNGSLGVTALVNAVPTVMKNATKVSPDNNVLTVYSIPVKGYKFSSLTVNGADSTSAVTAGLYDDTNTNVAGKMIVLPALTQDVVLSTSFVAAAAFTLTIAPVEGGSVQVYDGLKLLTTGASVYEGTALRVVATPTAGMTLNKISLGSVVAGSSPAVLRVGAADATLTVSFKLLLAVLQADNESLILTNNIVWNNAQGGTNANAATNLLAIDPGFTAIVDYGLNPLLSPGVNTASVTSLAGTVDLAGNVRSAGSGLDFGAYELSYYTLSWAEPNPTQADSVYVSYIGSARQKSGVSYPAGATVKIAWWPKTGYHTPTVTINGKDSVQSASATGFPVVLNENTSLSFAFLSPDNITSTQYAVYQDAGAIGLYNSIVFNNVFKATNTAAGSGNLLYIEPVFASSVLYTLKPVEPAVAIDMGTYSNPTGKDIAGSSRVSGTFSDCGAYESKVCTWTGANSTAWTDAANWADGAIPTADANAVIPVVTNKPVLTGNQQLSSLIIKPGAVLTLPAATSLVVYGNISNFLQTGSLILKADETGTAPNATLVFSNNSLRDTVAATVEMYSKATFNTGNAAGSRYNWQFVGSPLRYLMAKDLLPASNAYFRKYSESNTSSNWAMVDTTSMIYSFGGSEITQQLAHKYVMKGFLVNSDRAINLPWTYGSKYAGQHLLANSYTAAIDIRKIKFGSDMERTVYLYNTGNFNQLIGSGTDGTAGQYTAIPANLAGTAGLQAEIPSMQGYLVKRIPYNTMATNAQRDSVFTVTYSSVVMPTAQTTLQRAKAQTPSSDMTYSIVSVEGSRFADKLWLFNVAGCTTGYDNGWDGYKMIGSTDAPQLYASSEDANYQVYSTNDIANTVLGFRAGEDATYTMRFNHINMRSLYPNLYLVDAVANKTIDISADGASYTFAASKSDTENRFSIVANTGSTTDVKTPSVNANISMYSYDKTVVINNNTGKVGELMIYDIAGRFAQHARFVAGVNHIATALKAGTYVVKAVVPEVDVVVKSVIIK